MAGDRGMVARAVLAVVISACATLQEREPVSAMCDFAVFNRTPHSLEIRMQVRPLSTAPIGAINPGELLNHEAPCSDQVVRIGGLPIAQQMGAPVRFGWVQGWAELVEGERVAVSLEWP